MRRGVWGPQARVLAPNIGPGAAASLRRLPLPGLPRPPKARTPARPDGASCEEATGSILPVASSLISSRLRRPPAPLAYRVSGMGLICRLGQVRAARVDHGRVREHVHTGRLARLERTLERGT